jgi:hypothetical protein
LLFGPALIGVFAGFFELMMRKRAKLERPQFGQLIPPMVKETTGIPKNVAQ